MKERELTVYHFGDFMSLSWEQILTKAQKERFCLPSTETKAIAIGCCRLKNEGEYTFICSALKLEFVSKTNTCQS